MPFAKVAAATNLTKQGDGRARNGEAQIAGLPATLAKRADAARAAMENAKTPAERRLADLELEGVFRDLKEQAAEYSAFDQFKQAKPLSIKELFGS